MSRFTNPPDSTPEETAAYIRALLELLGDQDPFAIMRATPGELERGLAGVASDVAQRPEAPNKWSMAQVVQHLADSELVLGFRMRLVLAQDRPILSGYDQEAWAERLRYQVVAPTLAMSQFRTLREANLALLERMPDGDLDRVGLHSERGEESVRQMVRLYAAHDLVHRNQFERVKVAVTA